MNREKGTRMKRAILAAVIAPVIISCATTPTGPANRGEWEEIHVRTYEGMSPREVQDAAEKVLKLADHDFKFEYSEDRLVASRNWMVYATIIITGGIDYWTIETKPEGNGTKVTVRVTRSSNATTAVPVIGGPGIAPMTSATPGYSVDQRVPYQLFWERLNFSLGKRAEWTTCDAYKARLKNDGVRKRDRANLDILCSVTTDDKSPH